ncbi:Beta-mannosyltransferase 1 [Exophiala dermatitidis]
MPSVQALEQGAAARGHRATPLVSLKMRPLFSRRTLIAGASLFVLSLLFHQTYYLRGTEPLISSEVELLPNHHEKQPQQQHDKQQAITGSGQNYEARGLFKAVWVEGYDNTAIPGGEYVGQNLSCSTLAHSSEIGVQESFFLHDNFVEIAAELDAHPMIDYAPTMNRIKEGTFSLNEILAASWDRLATACVWMPDHGVHLCVSRIIFHPGGQKDRCRISFLRGQIYSENWMHLDRYTLKWKGREIQFPKVFDTPTEYKIGGLLFGPEDARIIIEEGVEDAEPVIVFNMITSRSNWKRAMWIFRPFSEQSNILTVRGTERPKKEKNWAPFFVRELEQDDPESNTTTSAGQPSKHIHFIWRFEPLTVLKCRLSTGMCDVVFEQKVLPALSSQHDDHDGSLRGGTQLIPIPLSNKEKLESPFGSPNVQAFVSFPRTHVEKAGGCRQAVYRPELTVLVTNTTHFYLTYASQALDFGEGVVMDADALADPCGKGRIMITNSIARWDLDGRDANGKQMDVMTLTLSVDDATVQVMMVAGVWNLLRGLPSLASYFGQQKVESTTEGFPTFANDAAQNEYSALLEPFDRYERANAVGWDVRACLEESALSYVNSHVDKVKQAEEKKKAAEKAKADEKQAEEKAKADEEKKKKDEAAKKAKEEEAKKKEAEAKKLQEQKALEEEEKKKKAKEAQQQEKTASEQAKDTGSKSVDNKDNKKPQDAKEQPKDIKDSDTKPAADSKDDSKKVQDVPTTSEAKNQPKISTPAAR